MTHDDETVERVARAINAARYGDIDDTRDPPAFEDEDKSGQVYAYRLARAALAAMPERDEENDTILRLSSINEHGEAPDGSVWRNIVINGEEYTIPYEVAMWFVHRGNERDASRELLREALEALVEAHICIASWGSYVSSYFQEKHDLEGDVARARAAADKIRAALTEEKQT